MTALNELSATEAAAAIAAKEITSEALTATCLERIAAREPDVEAWAHIDPDAALADARARDREAPKGPLHGVPVGFKDVIETFDMPTAYGSAIYPGHRPVADAACVALIRAAGGVILGKTVTTEFAFVNPGKTRNPHNAAHTPGGSSSGSAAAVADRMVPLALGTQTGGSVIRPASFCGAVGYKPTLGQFSYAGVKLLARSLDTLGAMARHVGDLALLRAALMGAPGSVAEMVAPPRLALCRTPWWDRADTSSHDAVEAAARQAEAAGASVGTVDLPEAFAKLEEANKTIMMYEGRRALAHEFQQHEDKLSDRLKAQMDSGAATSYADYNAAVETAHACRLHFAEIMSGVDALIVPAAVGEAPKGFETTGDATFNRPWTTMGTPCVTLPGHNGPNGLPVGAQLVANFGADDHLLAVASWVEAAMVAGN
ncbi:MAG: amidase [Alphaproteobacteria bacterium]|nr:amidase [Alphaproteobacteria bacterium]